METYRKHENWLVDKYGTRYWFKLVQDKITKDWEYHLDTIPELEEGSSLLWGKTIGEIISNLNMSEAVTVKEWDE